MKTIKSTLLVVSIILVFTGAFIIVQNKNLFTHGTKQEKKKEQDPHEKQLAYLKKHEEEIKEFVKSQNSKIESVQIDWEQTQWDQIGNGTPQGGGDIIDVYGTFNNIEESGWNVTIPIKDGKADLHYMGLSNGLSLRGELFE